MALSKKEKQQVVRAFESVLNFETEFTCIALSCAEKNAGGISKSILCDKYSQLYGIAPFGSWDFDYARDTNGDIRARLSELDKVQARLLMLATFYVLG